MRLVEPAGANIVVHARDSPLLLWPVDAEPRLAVRRLARLRHDRHAHKVDAPQNAPPNWRRGPFDSRGLLVKRETASQRAAACRVDEAPDDIAIRRTEVGCNQEADMILAETQRPVRLPRNWHVIMVHVDRQGTVPQRLGKRAARDGLVVIAAPREPVEQGDVPDQRGRRGTVRPRLA